jgi:hypothetical protein
VSYSERVLPQHFKQGGKPKRGYGTLADAVYAARVALVDGDSYVAYPCYCERYHIGRTTRTGCLTREEDFIWALEAEGWTSATVVDKWNPDGAVFWAHTGIGADRVRMAEAWKQSYALASAEAARRMARRPEILAARANVRGDETADEKRVLLTAAGWRRVNNPDPTVERWRRPGVTARTRGSSAKAGKSLDAAWLLFLRDTPTTAGGVVR